MRIRVLLPAPFSPNRAWISPGATSKSTSSLASTPGKRLVIPRISMSAGSTGEALPRSAAVIVTAPASVRRRRDGAADDLSDDMRSCGLDRRGQRIGGVIGDLLATIAEGDRVGRPAKHSAPDRGDHLLDDASPVIDLGCDDLAWRQRRLIPLGAEPGDLVTLGYADSPDDRLRPPGQPVTLLGHVRLGRSGHQRIVAERAGEAHVHRGRRVGGERTCLEADHVKVRVTHVDRADDAEHLALTELGRDVSLDVAALLRVRLIGEYVLQAVRHPGGAPRE